MRKKRLFYNTIASLAQEIVTLVCGFVLPKYIIYYYGSAVNGLLASISNMLAAISFLDMGVGAVVHASLFKPLAENNDEEISRIVKSAKKFFKKLALLLVVYICLLVIVFPLFVDDNFDFWFTATLIVAMGITSFAQYYFGVVNQTLLNADQKLYIQISLHIFTIVLNTIVSIVLISIGVSIQLVKLSTALIFLIRPFGMYVYVKKHYRINDRIELKGEPIKQKWNGLAQHWAAVVLDNTDSAMLTVFSTVENVSIYSVYYMVTNGIRRLIEKMTVGMLSLLGNMYAKNEKEKLNDTFIYYEWFVHTVATFLYTSTLILIIPFVQVYTKNINDVNYVVPGFAIVLTLSQYVYCLRIPYNTMVKAVGHFKETQISAFIEMGINIFITIFAIIKWGLIGVACGTLCAMVYRTIYLMWYSTKHVLNYSVKKVVKIVMIDAVIMGVSVAITKFIVLREITYLAWIALAVKKVLVVLGVVLMLECIFYRNNIYKMLSKFKKGKDLYE